MKNIANIITGARVLLTAAIIFVKPFGIAFYVLYGLCGASDMLDGFTARKFGISTRFGAVFDGAADLFFAAVALLKFLPVLEIKPYVWALAGAVCLTRLISAAVTLIKYRRIAFSHNYANKAAGLLAFMLPLTVRLADVNVTAIPVCAVALFAAVYEIILIGK